MTILVKYSCTLCGLTRVECAVPARGEEPIITWMDTMIRTLGADHAQRSPDCRPESLHDIMIPVTGADRIGGSVVN